MISLLRVVGLGAMLAAGSALAQTAATPAPDLSKKLDQTGGVLKPKDVDPGIEKPAPRTADPNVVTPPSDKSGVQPK